MDATCWNILDFRARLAGTTAAIGLLHRAEARREMSEVVNKGAMSLLEPRPVVHVYEKALREWLCSGSYHSDERVAPPRTRALLTVLRRAG